MTITSVININIIVDLQSVNKIKVDWPYVNKKKTKKFWQKFKIMKCNILHTPSKVGVLVSIIFSHTPEEAMSGGLAKACVPIKNWFCWREIEFPNFIHQYNHKKEIFYLNKRHATTDLTTNKIFFSNDYMIDIFLFITAVICLLVKPLAIYLLCKHKKLRMLVASLALQQVKEVGTVTKKEINTECKILAYISLTLTILV